MHARLKSQDLDGLALLFLSLHDRNGNLLFFATCYLLQATSHSVGHRARRYVVSPVNN